MKLNEHAKNELRKEIEEAVKRVPEGQRIELPLDLLDDLIFLKIKDKKGVTVKFPIWTGKFLRKIDLSEISFENAYMNSLLWNYIIEKFEKNVLTKFKKFDQHLILPFISNNKEFMFSLDSINSSLDSIEKARYIDFSDTNINIDFSKLYDESLYGVNFKNVNLSNANVNVLSEVQGTNFSNTNILGLPFYSMSNTDFSNNNLSNVTIDLSKLLKDFEFLHADSFPIFKNSFIHFNYESNINFNKKLGKIIKLGCLDNCYINGILINNNNEFDMEASDFAKKSVYDQYENMKNEIFESTMSSIEEQIKGFKGK